MAGPCAAADAATDDSSGRKLCHICRIHETLCGSYRPYDVVDAATSHVFVQNRDRSPDRYAVWVSALYPPVVTFASRRAYD